VELRPEENNPEEQCQDANPPCLAEHVGTKTKLRTEWLRGQGRRVHCVAFDGTGLDLMQAGC
jgi:hypothetical protein